MGMAMGGGGALRGRTLRYVTPRTRRKSYRPRPGARARLHHRRTSPFPTGYRDARTCACQRGASAARIGGSGYETTESSVTVAGRMPSPANHRLRARPRVTSGSWNPALVAWSQPSRWVSSPFRKERQRSAAGSGMGELEMESSGAYRGGKELAAQT